MDFIQRNRRDGYDLFFSEDDGCFFLVQDQMGCDGVTIRLYPEEARALADDLRKLLLQWEDETPQD